MANWSWRLFALISMLLEAIYQVCKGNSNMLDPRHPHKPQNPARLRRNQIKNCELRDLGIKYGTLPILNTTIPESLNASICHHYVATFNQIIFYHKSQKNRC